METYKIKKDQKHGFYRADPIPTKDEVNRYYLEEFYAQNDSRLNNSSLEVQLEEEEFYTSKYENYATIIENVLKGLEKKSLFDIGCGFAQSLLFFRDVKKMEVSGIEPSLEGVKYAKDNNLDVVQGNIESSWENNTKKFDVITLLNVLEHLRNPEEVLKAIRENLLKNEGVLLIDVPNDFNDFQTIASDEYNLNQWWFYPPRHINYFNSETLSNLLNECGYDIVHVEASFPLDLFLLLGDVYVGNNSLGKICHEKRVKFEQLMRKHGKKDKLSKFYKSLAELQLGRDVVILAKPRVK